MGRMCSWLVCAVAVLLPWRLRIVFADLIAWVLQGLYYTYFRLLKFLLDSLEGKEARR